MRRSSSRLISTLSIAALIAGSAASSANAHEPAHDLEQAAVEAAVAELDGGSARPAATPQFTPLNTVTDDRSTTVRLQQLHNGIPVLGGHTLVHFKDGEDADDVTGTSGETFQSLSVDTTAVLDEADAVLRALSFLDNPAPGVTPEAGEPELVVLPQGDGRLTWHVSVAGVDPETTMPMVRQLYVDARTGALALEYDSVNLAGPVQGQGTSHAGDTYPLQAYERDDAVFELRDRSRDMWTSAQGEILTYDAKGRNYWEYLGQLPADTELTTSPTSNFGDRATDSGAVDAHWGAGHVYDYYKDTFGRDGLDGQGGSMISVVGVTSYGRPFTNAFWDGTKMVYGYADGYYRPLSSDLDVVGHEMTHGVITNSADLIYLHQSGAMNEALADYFGNAIDVDVTGTSMDDPESGLIGEDLCVTAAPADCALRDLNDDRTTVDDYLGTTVRTDSGGVHLNSTIFSGALWDIRQRLDTVLADKVVYKALVQYMTPTDDFADGRLAIEDAAAAMGLSAGARQIIADSFDDHGIYEGWESDMGLDSRLLFGAVTDAGVAIDASGGRFVTTNTDVTGQGVSAVYRGRTTGNPTVRQVSPDDGATHDSPATDGESVAWVRYSPTDGYSILRASMNGNAAPEVIRPATTQVSLGNVTVDGDSVAWTESGPSTGFVTKVKAFRDGQILDATPGEGVGGGWLSLSGDHLGFIEISDSDTGGFFYTPTAYHLQSGELYPLTTPVENSYSKDIVLGESFAYWIYDSTIDGNAGIKRAKLDGSRNKTIVDEAGEDSIFQPTLDGNDKALTYSERGTGTFPLLFQIKASGGPAISVTCNRGDTSLFASDRKKQVVWLDGTAGQSDVVTRKKPIGDC